MSRFPHLSRKSSVIPQIEPKLIHEKDVVRYTTAAATIRFADNGASN